MRGLEKTCLIFLIVLALGVISVVVSLASFLSPADHLKAVFSPETLFALRFTLITSSTAIVLALILAVPAAYFLARRNFAGKQILDTILDLPLVMPPLIAGVGLLLLLGNSPIGNALAAIGIQLVFSPAGVILAQAFVATFIVLRGAKAAFEAVEPRYESAALTMGLHPWQVFWRVTLPMAKRGLLAGAVLGWARAMGEFGATLMVAGATRFRTETMPISVYLNISSGEPGIAISCALLLLLMGLVLLGLLRWFSSKASHQGAGNGGY